MESTIYRCDKPCRLHKKCFILKVQGCLQNRVPVLIKCAAENGKDIRCYIGGRSNPIQTNKVY